MSMRISLGQSQRQQQKQVLTQRLIQSMELLQLSNQELEQRIEEELEGNPVLEIAEDADDSSDTVTDSDDAGEDEPTPDNGEEEEAESQTDEDGLPPEGGEEPADGFEQVYDFAETYADTIDEEPARLQNWLEDADERHQDLINNIASRGETLEENLSRQIAWFNLDDRERKACETLIEHIDRSGLLTTPLEEFWKGNDDPAEREIWEKALRTIQSMDPPGVGARSTAEALLLQVTDETPHCRLVRQLISRHFDDILHNRIPLIVKETGYTKEQIEEGIGEIRKLNPRPGSEFEESDSYAVIPDLYAYKGDDGRWDVDINDENQIRLGINSEYKAMLKEKETDRDAKEFLRKHIGQAQWFIEALRQRKLTLLRVGQAIVRYQNDFFEIGPEKLRPLKMQQIADELGIHIATVSRACDGKWLQSPQGIYPLKSFFSGAVKTETENEELTAKTVKSKIKELIDREDKKSPLSDEEIAARLKKEGIEVSRRTVAKYRDALLIPSSRQRKEWA